jgi:hypothetical protein
VSALLAAVSPSPSPTSQAVGSGSPGFIGFVFTFALAIAAVLLFLSLTRHLRIVQRRSEAAEAEGGDEGAAGGEGDQRDRPAGQGIRDVGAAGADLEMDSTDLPSLDDRDDEGRG